MGLAHQVTMRLRSPAVALAVHSLDVQKLLRRQDAKLVVELACAGRGVGHRRSKRLGRGRRFLPGRCGKVIDGQRDLAERILADIPKLRERAHHAGRARLGHSRQR